MINHI